jgi:hypothetical protein
MDPLGVERLGVAPVAALNVAHGGEYTVPGLCERLRGVATEAAAGAGNQDSFGHDKFLSWGKADKRRFERTAI